MIIFLLWYINVLLVELLIIFFSFTNSTHDHDTRGTSSNSLVVPQFKNNSGKRLFQARAANLWNSSVDVDTRINYISLSLSEFKSRASQNPLIIDFSIVFNFSWFNILQSSL